MATSKETPFTEARVSRPAIPRRRSGPVQSIRPGGNDLLLDIVRQEAGSVLAVARRFSLCADDAHDAYQRAMEILIKRIESLDPSTAGAWLRTVVKHEAMAVRADRMKALSSEELEVEAVAVGADPSIRSERFARLAAAAEALDQLKPHEAEALLLKAQGLSYDEIAEHRGWTYTKVNRLLSEGRQAFRERVESIEKGAECERLEPLLSKVADGEGRVRDRRSVAAHLRRCGSCRKQMRAELERSQGFAALAPFAAIAMVSQSGSIGRPWEVAIGWFGDRLLGGAIRVQTAAEAAAAGKVAAVAATAAAVAGGGVAAEKALQDKSVIPRPAAHSVAYERSTGGAESAAGSARQSSGNAPEPSPASAAPTAEQPAKPTPPAEPVQSDFDALASSSAASGVGQEQTPAQPVQAASTVAQPKQPSTANSQGSEFSP